MRNVCSFSSVTIPFCAVTAGIGASLIADDGRVAATDGVAVEATLLKVLE